MSEPEYWDYWQDKYEHARRWAKAWKKAAKWERKGYIETETDRDECKSRMWHAEATLARHLELDAKCEEATRRLADQQRQAVEERDRLREVVEHYANEDNWDDWVWVPDEAGYTVAQAALAALEVKPQE